MINQAVNYICQNPSRASVDLASAVITTWMTGNPILGVSIGFPASFLADKLAQKCYNPQENPKTFSAVKALFLLSIVPLTSSYNNYRNNIISTNQNTSDHPSYTNKEIKDTYKKCLDNLKNEHVCSKIKHSDFFCGDTNIGEDGEICDKISRLDNKRFYISVINFNTDYEDYENDRMNIKDAHNNAHHIDQFIKKKYKNKLNSIYVKNYLDDSLDGTVGMGTPKLIVYHGSQFKKIQKKLEEHGFDIKSEKSFVKIFNESSEAIKSSYHSKKTISKADAYKIYRSTYIAGVLSGVSPRNAAIYSSQTTRNFYRHTIVDHLKSYAPSNKGIKEFITFILDKNGRLMDEKIITGMHNYMSWDHLFIKKSKHKI